jgi:hypothetical protein
VWKVSQAGVKYAVFSLPETTDDVRAQDADDRRREVLDLLKRYSAIEVELAATADFLKRNGYPDDPWTETRRRKASKVTGERLEKSQQLLREMAAI